MNIVSFSGGKDSTAMLLRMVEKGVAIDKIIFCDTTLEFPEIYDYLEKIQNYLGRKIEILKPSKSWDDWFYGKITRGKLKGRRRGFPYVCSPCWWNREAKYLLLDRAHKALGRENTVFVGIAKDEEYRTYKKQYRKPDINYRFPLVEWGVFEKECYEYLEKKGLKHPLSDCKRTGCWLCPKQSKSSLLFLMREYPQLWIKLKKYETDSPHGFKPNFNLIDFENKNGRGVNEDD
ncbi:MAG: phosphoadenosine phosphosulfate reductase family protein [Desulfobacteraceae bacterium]|jgi:3'-phosphoadenosine 5'-phosphosulfate sulfotransferase (PAPS reductase)/FAD synthetase